MTMLSSQSGEPREHRSPVSPQWRTRLSFWSTAADAPRKRRPSDVLALGVGVIVLVVLHVPAPGPTEVEASAVAFIGSIPGLEWLWASLYTLALVWTLVLLLAAAATRHRRIVLVEQIGGAALAVAGGAFIAVWNGATWEEAWQALVPGAATTAIPVVHMCVVVTVVGVSLPHLARQHRRVSLWITGLAVLGAIGSGLGTPLALLTAVAVGVTASAVAHLAFGSPGGHRPIALLYGEMADLGVPSQDVGSWRGGLKA